MMQKNKGLSIVQQKSMLEKEYPNSKVAFVGHNKIVWNYQFKPTELSSFYDIKLVFDGISPEVFVVNPNPLKKAKGECKLPHVYDQKNNNFVCIAKTGIKLCLCQKL